MKLNIIFKVIILALVFNGHVRSEYITQINIQQAGVVDSVYIKLLESDAPLTVQNFRNYVTDGDYVNSFIHRSISGFIIQGGGFSFDPALNDGAFTYNSVNDTYPGGLQPVPVDSPVINEFGNSNLRGTLAMAKVAALYQDDTGVRCFTPDLNCTLVPGTGPDSATSQWFVNLVDNTADNATALADLDSQNGGYTVFAEILGNGMTVFDGVASQSVYNLTGLPVPSAFNSIPLLNFSLPPVISDNLVFVKSINEILSISPDISYGMVTSGSNLQPEVVIENMGVNPVSIGDIGSVDSLAAPYSIVSNLCSNEVLSPGQRCTLIALFSPESPGVYYDSFDIDFPDLGINYLVNLSGKGGAVVAEADIASSYSSVDYGVRDVLLSLGDAPYTGQVYISNSGDMSLELFTIGLSPGSDSEFTLSGDCIGTNNLVPGEFCAIEISFIPMAEGSYTAKLIVESSDPDEGVFEIPIFAVASTENDGINKVIEDAAQNNGDGNNDDILDSQQSNVVSLPDLKATYLTYVVTPNQYFMDVRIANQSALDENPDNIILEAGVHEFTIDNVASNEIVEVGLILPANVNLSGYYIFGSTSENATPHWYSFDFDGETGAVFLGQAIMPSATGDITRNLVTLKFKNGGRGDSSSADNSKLVVKSGINYTNVSSDGGGFISSLFLSMTTLIFLFLRKSRYSPETSIYNRRVHE